MSTAYKKYRCVRVILATVVAFVGLGLVGMPSNGHAGPAANVAYAPVRTKANRELFGMVVRDPFYEYNTDPANFPQASNRAALEQQAKELSAAGVKWIRMEFFADYDGSVRPGDINWSKYDWFLKDLVPRYGFKVLGLLNVGMVAHEGKTLRTVSFNDPPDGGGATPGDGSNHFIRVFTGRAQEIARRYKDYIHAYEIINEPNISWDLWNDTGFGSAEIKPDRYAALITSAYRAIKNVAPQAEVITGGMLLGTPPEGKDYDQFDYLYQMYTSQWVEWYRLGGYSSRPGWNTVPWDGVAVHPYFLETPKLFALLKEFSRKLRDRSDYRSKLWITEIGAEADPPEYHLTQPSEEERQQAEFLRELYTGVLNDGELRSNVAHIFWFKYEDFVPGNYTHNYGLVRLHEAPSGKAYHPSGQVRVRKLAYRTYQEIALGYKLTDPANRDEALTEKQYYFEETRQAIAPEFAAYWLEKGGLERFGYPISRPMGVNGYLSQFFERAVFEYHPEHAGTPHEVLLRLVGVEFTRGMVFHKADPENVPPDRLYFPETGHTLGGVFRTYWEQNGGLPVYGYPISEEITEVSPTNGETYTVQYFERNRFEHHPEKAGTPYEVQLGLLGANLLSKGLWWR